MIITISGKAGTGKSTVARLLSAKLGLSHYSIGDLMRSMAQEKSISIMELNKRAENDKSIDIELDKKLKLLGEKKDDFIVDGRLAAHFIPHADARVFLNADDVVRAERIMKDDRNHERSASLKAMLGSIKEREDSEKARYVSYYGVDYLDKRLYNCIIETTKLTPDEVAGRILKFVKNLLI